jgi:hypothetical protein
MTIYILINGRTRAICGVFSSNDEAIKNAEFYQIDSWHVVERKLDAAPVQYA